MKKILSALFLTFILLLCGCSNDSNALRKENVLLKNKIVQLNKDINDRDNKIKEFQSRCINDLTINYYTNTDKKRFVEKQINLLALPVNNSLYINIIQDNTVVSILDTASVNNEMWYYVLIPVYDSPINYKGWIKKSDTVPYTKEKISKVQSDVTVKAGENIYETEDFSSIKSVTPQKSYGDRGRIIEKQGSYLKLMCPGGRDIWIRKSSAVYPELE